MLGKSVLLVHCYVPLSLLHATCSLLINPHTRPLLLFSRISSLPICILRLAPSTCPVYLSPLLAPSTCPLYLPRLLAPVYLSPLLAPSTCPLYLPIDTHQTVPARTLCATLIALLRSFVCTAAASPYIVLLALSITSSTVLNLIICCTGPKIYNRKIESLQKAPLLANVRL